MNCHAHAVQAVRIMKVRMSCVCGRLCPCGAQKAAQPAHKHQEAAQPAEKHQEATDSFQRTMYQHIYNQPCTLQRPTKRPTNRTRNQNNHKCTQLTSQITIPGRQFRTLGRVVRRLRLLLSVGPATDLACCTGDLFSSRDRASALERVQMTQHLCHV